MATKNVKLNFFQIVPRKGSASRPSEIRKVLLGMGGATFKARQLTTKVLYLSEPIKPSAGYFLGTIVDNQMNDIPPTGNYKTAKIDPLNLTDEQGLAKAVSFLIDPQANILILEQGSVGPKSLCAFLQENLALPPIEPALLINPGQMQKFYKMTSVIKFHTRLAKIEDGSLFFGDEKKKSTSQVMQSADDTNMDELNYTIEVTPQHHKQGKALNKGKISNFIQELLPFKDTEEVKEMTVSGYVDDEDRITVIDLVKEHLHDYIEIHRPNRIVQSFDIPQHYEKIEIVYAKHRQSLLRTYALKE